MQANAINSTNELIPPDALSYNSEGYVNDDEDIANIRSNQRRSFAPSETSESYMDMSGRPLEMGTNSAYNVANSVEVPSGRPLDMEMNSAYNVADSVEVPYEDPPRFEYVVSSSQYEEILERGYPRPPSVVTGPTPIATRPPSVAREPPDTRGSPTDHETATVEEKKAEPHAKILCGFRQGRTEVGLRATILIVSCLQLAIIQYSYIRNS